MSASERTRGAFHSLVLGGAGLWPAARRVSLPRPTLRQNQGCDRCGACDKTRVLLSALQDAGTLMRYVPFDVSDEFLRSAADTLSDEFDGLDLHLVIGDFHHHLAQIPGDGRRMGASRSASNLLRSVI